MTPGVSPGVSPGWPYECAICRVGSVNQLCNPCSQLFERGLRTKLKIKNKLKKLDIHSIKYHMGRYFTETRSMPESIKMNVPTYSDYCSINWKLPKSPLWEDGDSLHTVTGVPINISHDKGYGYNFSDHSSSGMTPT
jgi:hypothetical protein